MERKPRVLVTRPRAQAREMVRLLSRAGLRVISTPLIKIVPPASFRELDKSLFNIDKSDAVVFTSANAVEHFFARARRLGLRNLKAPGKVFAIGRKTAQALSRSGWRKVRSAEDSRGEGLAELMGRVRGLRILIPRAKVAREVLPGLLRARGAKVSVVEVYRNVPDASGLRTLKAQELEKVAAVTFTSDSTVEMFVRALGSARCRGLFARAAAASLGPVTSAALRRRGIAPAVEAKTADARALCAALIGFLRRRPSRRARA